MNRVAILSAVSIFTACAAASQTEAGAQAASQASSKETAAVQGSSASQATQLASGSTVPAKLSKPLDANKNKVGDEVSAKTTQDVKSDGKVVIPKGTKLLGHVTEVQAKTKENANSSLGIAFDRLELKNGDQVPLHLMIHRVSAVQASAGADFDEPMGGGMPASGGMGGGARVGGAGIGNVTSGVTSTAGSTVGTATNTGAAVGGDLNGVARAAGGTNSTVNAAGSAQSVIGLKGVSLDTQASGSAQGSILTGNGRIVHLDSGTMLELKAQAQ